MKRGYPAKRRDRKTGISPYARYNKAPFQYSAVYYKWRSQFKTRAQREAKAA